MARTGKKQKAGDRLLQMLFFQVGLCALAVAVFFAGSQEQTRWAAAILCGQDSPQLIDWEAVRAGGWLERVSSFWQGGAQKLLEQLQQFLLEQVAPPEELGDGEYPAELVPGMSEEQAAPSAALSLQAALGAVGAGSYQDRGADWKSGAGEELTQGESLPAAEGTTLAPYYLTASMWSPVSGLVTSRFGWRLHPVSGEPDFHTGMDIAAAQGESIHAALPGVVEQTGYSESYGNFVILRHSDNLRTRYCHCSELLCHEGEVLRRGDRIALVGSTGISTGPHLHFEVEVQGSKADPQYALAGEIQVLDDGAAG